MSKSFKKVVACLLAVLMVCFSMPFTALAAPGDYAPDVQLEFGTITDDNDDASEYFGWVSQGNPAATTQIATKANLSTAAQSGIYGPKLVATGSVDRTTGVYSVTGLTLEASDTNAWAEFLGYDPLEADYNFGVGDLITVTVRMDNVDGVATSSACVQYSDNITPAGFVRTGTATRRVSYIATAEQAEALSAQETVGMTEPLAASSANSLYNEVDSAFGDQSLIVTDDEGISYMYACNASGIGEKLDVSSINALEADPDLGVLTIVDEDGNFGYDYAGKYVMETFVFMITEEISEANPITFQMYDTNDSKRGGFEGGYFIYDNQADGIMTHQYTTYAKNLTNGVENPGSAKMTFMGTNVNVQSAEPTHTHSYSAVTTQPTCEEDGYITYTCNNEDGYGTAGDDTYTEGVDLHPELAKLGHNYVATVTPPTHTEKGYTTYVCSRDSSHTYVGDYVDETGHTPGDPVNENVVPATCTTPGSHDVVVYCTEDGAEISRTNVQDDVIPHTPGEAVKENEILATEDAGGSYDLVVYCTECGTEISREHKTTPPADHVHTYTDKVVDPTCTEKGYTIHTCVKGDDEYIDSYVDALDHAPAEAVKENEVAATNRTDGSYDSVVYCTRCGEEISRETITVPATGIIVTVDGTYAQYGDVNVAYGENKYAYLSEVTLTAAPVEGATFVGWEISGKRVSEDATLTFTATSDVTVTPIFADSADTITVVFLDRYNNVTYSYVGDVAGFAAAMQDAIPEGTNYPGYTFEGWSLTDEEILAIDKSTTVTANYAETGNQYTVAINGTGTIDGEAVTSKAVSYDTPVTVSSEGATAWKVDGAIVYYGETYTFFVGSDITLTPVTDTVDTKPEVAMINATVSDASKKKVNYLASMSITDGNTLLDHGFVYVANKVDKSALTIDSAGTVTDNGKVIKKITAGATGSDQFALNYSVSTAQYATVLAYITYKAEDGTVTTQYTDPVVFDYNAMAVVE